jgi:hypothetical protein
VSAYGGRAEADRLSRLTMDERRELVSEGAFQAKVIELATRLGWRLYHTYDSRRSQPGFPDLIGVRGDRMVAIECKREGQKPTAEQWEWLRALAEVRWVTSVVARPNGDWSDIEALLR